jgi:hypothetical protein
MENENTIRPGEQVPGVGLEELPGEQVPGKDPQVPPPAAKKEPIASHILLREEPIAVKARELAAGARLELVPDPPKDPTPAPGPVPAKPGGALAVVVVVVIVVVAIVALSVLVFKMLPPDAAPGPAAKKPAAV